MKNIFKLSGIIVMAAVIGFSFAACGGGAGDPGSSWYNNDPGGFAGTWTGTVSNIPGNPGNHTATATMSTSGYTISVPDVPYNYAGNFNRTNNYVEFYNADAHTNGTAVLLTPTRIKLDLNNYSDLPGTYTFTKPGDTTNVPGDLAGTWEVTVDNVDVTFTMNGTGWTMRGEIDGDYYFEIKGNFTQADDSAVIYSGSGINFGTMVLNDPPTTASLTLNEASGYPGNYTFTKN